MARTPTNIIINGKSYVFDTSKVQNIWKYFGIKCQDGPKKKQIIDEIAEETHCSENTVKDWLNGKYGPSDPKAVEVIASKLQCERTELLKEIEENKGMEERKITKMERKAARKVYGELCDMLDFIDWEDELNVIEFPFLRIRAWSRFENQYEAEQYYLLLVRKTAIDLPKGIREELTKLIQEAFEFFGETIDPPYGLNTKKEEYKKILEEKDREKKIEAIYLYVGNYRERISERLDSIFEQYMRK